jgi:hypothetical protein
MRRGLCRLVATLVWLFVLGAASHARADPLRELLERGTQALRDKRAVDARAAFEQGVRRADNEPRRWQMQLGLALALVLEERFAEAAHTYRAFLRGSADHPAAASARWVERRARALQDLADLERRLLLTHARLDIQSDPPGAALRVGGAAFAETTPLVIYLPAGRHRLAYELAGYQTVALSVLVEAGQQPLIHRELVPLPLPADPAPAPRARSLPEPEMRTSLVTPGALLLATGAALVLGAGAVHWTALRDAGEVRTLQTAAPTDAAIERDRALRERIADYQAAYATLYAVGGASAATGAALLLAEILAGHRDDRVTGWWDRESGGVGWRGRF